MPEAATLVQELHGFKRRVTAAGHDTDEAWREGTHDDLVLAVALAGWYREWWNACLDRTTHTYTYFVLCCVYQHTGRMAEEGRQREMFTVAEAARLLGLSVRGVQDRIKKGEMQAEKVTPRLCLVHRNEIERWKSVGKRKGGRPRKQQEPS